MATDPAIETAVRIVVELLVRGDHATAEGATKGVRLSADAMAKAIDEYGRHLVSPTDDWWPLVDVTPITYEPGAFHVAAPLWTMEEGRSDLMVELRLHEFAPGVFAPEILDIHVL